MGIFLGLAAALSWGFSDFIARFSTRRVGTLRTLLYMQTAGFVLLTAALPYLGGWGHLADGSGWQPWAWGVLAGCINTLSTLALFRSFEIGTFSIVAPISSSFPALTVVLSLLTGERLTLERGAGVALTIVGVILAGAASDPGGDANGNSDASGALPARATNKGVLLAVLAAVGYGVLFWLLGIRIVPRVGGAVAVWMIRLTSMVIAFVVVLVARQPLRFPRASYSWYAAGMGLFDTGAFVCNNLGVTVELVSVVSVLASLYGVVTVFLAAVFLRERPARRQWIGVCLIFAGIYFVSR